MPLPAALLQRLKKRGIIKQQAPPVAVPQEEIIAENYDDDGGQQASAPSENKAVGAPGCPNKNNPFHLCVEWCWDHWGDGTPEDRVDPDYNRRRLRMLRLHPLPAPWKEIYDPGSARYYYWNMETDEVCWLSPTHPRAKITVAACRVAKNEWEKFSKEINAVRGKSMNVNVKDRRRKETSPPPSGDSSEEEQAEPELKQKREGGKKRNRNDLDPMDPAAYSDVPRGKWSTGLETRGDAKTGVDTTASGPLFQQRPYPAPGAILRANMEQQKKKRRRVDEGGDGQNID